MNLQELFDKVEEKLMGSSFIKALIIIFFIPFMFVLPMIFLIILSYINRNLIHINMGISLHDYVYYYIYFMTMITSAVFSYMVYKVTKKNNKIAEDNSSLSNQTLILQQKLIESDNNRELVYIKENALIVFYDLYLGLNDIMKLYISICINEWDNVPQDMFFSNDWIKNAAVLRRKLSDSKQIESIYLLYGDMLMAKEGLIKYSNTTTTTPNKDDFIPAVVRIAKNCFSDEYIRDLEDLKEYITNGTMKDLETHVTSFSGSINLNPRHNQIINDYTKIKPKYMMYSSLKLDKIDYNKHLNSKYSALFKELDNLIK